MMMLLIRNLLQHYIDKIDEGSSDFPLEKLEKLLSLLIDGDLNKEDLIMSKLAAADYLGISRATFDNHVRDGLLPKGHKYPQLKELIWFKYEIDLYKVEL